MKKYAMGGRMMRPEREPASSRMINRRSPGPVPVRPLPETEPVYKKGGSVKESKAMMKKGGTAKSGGSYRKAADGIASKGKTKVKQIRMRKGGYCG